VVEQRLLRAGFETMGDLARADSKRLEETIGNWGLEVAHMARGWDVREVEPYREAVSYSEENIFERDVSDREILEATLLAHAENVARRLRRDELEARTVVLKWRSGGSVSCSASRSRAWRATTPTGTVCLTSAASPTR